MGAIYKNIIDEHNALDRLFNLSFKECARKISTMDTMKKADVAAQIQPILSSLYLQADKYGNPDFPRDEQIGPDMFIHIMSRIKRWETILYWLYEIDILMGETKLDQMIREAEQRCEKVSWDLNATRIRCKNIIDEDGEVVKKRIKVNMREDLDQLRQQRTERSIHTEEIMTQAKQLAQKYFK